MPNTPLSRSITAASLAALILACGHSESFTGTDGPITVPFSTAEPIRLTYNPGNNYWPTWTEDGRGIIYSYSRQFPDTYADDRCVGVLPPSGGSTLWEMCDTRREHRDSADSFHGVAIDSSGRVLYLEFSTRRGSGGLSGVNQPPQSRSLWLADTAYPFQGRKLLDLSFGMRSGGLFFNALRDVQWVDSNSFVGLAVAPPLGGDAWDTTGAGQGVVRGEITSTGATLSMIPGTQGTVFYSRAEGGGTLILSMGGTATLQRIPLAGGTAVPVVTLPFPAFESNITCHGTDCLAAAGSLVWRVDLTTGTAAPIATPILYPRLSPATGDVVGIHVTSSVRIQAGGPVQNLTSIFLYKGVSP